MATALHDLAEARADAAAALEQAIAALGLAMQTYAAATAALERESPQGGLALGIETSISMHLAQAGLGAFLERKLTGKPAALRELVSAQYRRLAIG